MSEGALRWRAEYAMEAFGLGAFMVAACACATALEHPASPLRHALDDAFVRRACMGLAMGATAIALIHSPWGRRSGAHINPAVTLTFLRLGRIAGSDALAYMAAQFSGAALGVALCEALGLPLAHPSVDFVVTRPGAAGVLAAAAAEFTISFVLMAVVLAASARPRLEPWTGRLAGSCVALFITFEAPLSGMSMNPARTFGSALLAGDWRAWWLYALAPIAGMLAAAEIFARRSRAVAGCAKLRHCELTPCLFCGRTAAPRGTPVHEA